MKNKKPSPPVVSAWEVTDVLEQLNRLTMTVDVIAEAMRSEHMYKYSVSVESVADSIRNLIAPLEIVTEQAHETYYTEFEAHKESQK